MLNALVHFLQRTIIDLLTIRKTAHFIAVFNRI